MPSKSLDADFDANADSLYKIYIQLIHGYNVNLDKNCDFFLIFKLILIIFYIKKHRFWNRKSYQILLIPIPEKHFILLIPDSD